MYKPHPALEGMTSRQYLDLLTTRELMSMLANARAYGDYTITVQGKKNRYYEFMIRLDEIKEVLTNRPHIPSKEERRKTINQQKGIKR